MITLEIKNISKSFDGIKAADDFSCSIDKGSITGLIGPNGAGKTTVFNIITGFIKQDLGSYYLNKHDISNLSSYKIVNRKMVRTFQDLRLIMELSVVENVLLFFHGNPGEKLFNVFFNNNSIKKKETANYKEAEKLLDFAGLLEKKNENAGNLSYGQQKLLSICCCLAADPEIILLDEPVSGVQPQTIEKISAMLKELVDKQNKTIFLIEHNMDFVFKNCDKVIVMDDGKKIAEGTPSEIENNREILEAYLN
jgi:ABC-type branched-subunit amino acid transport system ATPase component